MIGLLACLASCSAGHDDNNDPVDVDEAPPPAGAAGGRQLARAREALRPLSTKHLPDPTSTADDGATEAYHTPPDSAAMQMISSGYDPNQAGDDDAGDSEDGKHFVVPDTQVSYGRQGKAAN